MNRLKQIALFSMVILSSFLYLIYTNQNKNSKPVRIRPILIIHEEPSKKNPKDILFKLKVATTISKEGILPDKEEISKKVLKTLKEKIGKQEVTHIETTSPLVAKKSFIKKKNIIKKIITKKKISKKKIAKKIIKKKTIHKQKKKLASTARLTQEKKVVISKAFEIKPLCPDTDYFEPIQKVTQEHPHQPLKFVKKLEVVTVSNPYETHMAIPKKVELAKEGVVSISTATTETEALKKLKFVQPLEVIEVSKEFESIEAKKYLP